MFSATWPKEIRQLAGDFLNNPVHLQSGSSELTSNKNITQHVKIVDETEKPQLLLEILEDVKKEVGDNFII
jgi:superfamily II DNA/RNA helicase